MPSFRRLRHWFLVDENALAETDRARLASTLEQSTALKTFYAMRRDLAALWGRSTDSREELLARLQDWCHRAETSNIGALQNFSRRLRSYA
jgi:stearoyl-CoA desaturase (Delta-9 desaturase)